jgi:multidrug transporter EmrE-like cation transporter
MPGVATTRRGQTVGYVYILGAILLTVYGQLVTKWQVAQSVDLPVAMVEKAAFVAHLVLDPKIVSGLTALVLAFSCWVMALSRFELSYACLVTGLSFVLVSGLSVLFFGETITVPRGSV